jgi:hypothetical protein
MCGCASRGGGRKRRRRQPRSSDLQGRETASRCRGLPAIEAHQCQVWRRRRHFFRNRALNARLDRIPPHKRPCRRLVCRFGDGRKGESAGWQVYSTVWRAPPRRVQMLFARFSRAKSGAVQPEAAASHPSRPIGIKCLPDSEGLSLRRRCPLTPAADRRSRRDGIIRTRLVSLASRTQIMRIVRSSQRMLPICSRET